MLKLLLVLSIVVLATANEGIQNNGTEHGSEDLQSDELTRLLEGIFQISSRPKRNIETETIDNKSERPSQAACRKYNEATPSKIDSTCTFEGKPVPVLPGQYPHMGALMYISDDDDGTRNLCGSFLISKRYVLTAAHCVHPRMKPTFVRFGVVWNSTDEHTKPLDVEIEKITSHPEYVYNKRYHDIALILLRKDVEFNDLVRPACLYSDSKDIDPESKLIVTGWGNKGNLTSYKTRSVLQIQKLNTVPLQDCNATYIDYGEIRSLKNGLNEGHYCARGLLENECLSQHSGSPLQLVQDKKPATVVGIVSFGIGCGDLYPTVNTRVAYYLDWIESVVWPTSSSHPKRSIERGTIDNKTERPSQAACRKYNEATTSKIDSTWMFQGQPVPVPPGEYPHMGALMYPRDKGDSNECGSFLISERYVLTAAHCVNYPEIKPTFVRFGVVVWNSTDDHIKPLDVEIEKITSHPEYLYNKRYHDIALILLRRDVEFNELVRPACLYSDTKDIAPKSKLVVSGWGSKGNIYSRDISYVLQKKNLYTVPLQDCNVTHFDFGVRQSYKNGLNEGHYCANEEFLENECLLQHSGSPLQLVKKKNPTTVVGIVAFGIGCGYAIPSVYTRVAYYLDWIESVVWPTSSS